MTNSEGAWSDMRDHVMNNSDLELESDNIPDPTCVIVDGKCVSGEPVHVTVTYDFELILGWVLPSPIELSRTVEMMVQ